MALPSRKSFTLDRAAKILNCEVEDIVHWAANGETRIGILYSADSFDPPIIYDHEELNKPLEDFQGFAFIDSGYLMNAEIWGKCTFTSLELTDGRVILFKPDPSEGSAWTRYVIVGIELPRLFIRAEELDKLQEKHPQELKELVPNERDSLLKLVIGMAVGGYRYNPAASKNDAVSEITKDLEGLGISLSDDTIRKYLKLATTKIPRKPHKT